MTEKKETELVGAERFITALTDYITLCELMVSGKIPFQASHEQHLALAANKAAAIELRDAIKAGPCAEVRTTFAHGYGPYWLRNVTSRPDIGTFLCALPNPTAVGEKPAAIPEQP